MEVASLALAVPPLLAGCAKLAKLVHDTRAKYKSAPLTLELISAECSNVSFNVITLESLMAQDLGLYGGGSIEERIWQRVRDMMAGCTKTIDLIEEKVKEIRPADDYDGAAEALRRSVKARYVWNEDDINQLLLQLRNHQTSLAMTLSILQTQRMNRLCELLVNQGTVMSTVMDCIAPSRLSRLSPKSAVAGTSQHGYRASPESENLSATSFEFDDQLLKSHIYRRVRAAHSMENQGTNVSQSPSSYAADSSPGAVLSLSFASSRKTSPSPTQQWHRTAKMADLILPLSETLPIRQKGVKIMPAHYEYCDINDLGSLIADMLSSLAVLNDDIPLHDAQLTRFHSSVPPDTPIRDYLSRLITHATLSPSILLAVVYYMDRLCALYPPFTLSSLTVHRYLTAAITVAAKGLSDNRWANSIYARISGVSVRDLTLLELEFLIRLEWRIVPQPDILVDYYRSLIERSCGFVMDDATAAATSTSGPGVVYDMEAGVAEANIESCHAI